MAPQSEPGSNNDWIPQWPAMDVATREREYSPSSAVGGNIEPYLDAYRTASADARRRYAQAGANMVELAYGPSAAQTIDLVVPRQGLGPQPVTLVVYIHGGYWQQLSKDESHVAPSLVERGVGYAAVNYTLAPDASLDEIVDECRQAVRRLVQVSTQYGIDSERIIIVGSSAGAHLAVMVALRSPVRLGGLVLMSGIYDLEPLVSTSINDAVGMDIAAAHRNSPMRHDLSAIPSSVVSWGGIETDEFKRQSKTFANQLASASRSVTLIEVGHCNHFDIIHEFGDGSSGLGAAVSALISKPGSTNT